MSEKREYMLELVKEGRQMATRIAQAFPHLASGLILNEFSVEFIKEDHSDTPLAHSLYDEDNCLTTIQLNRGALQEQYKRLSDQVSFGDLVRIHAGNAVSMDLLFQQTRRKEGRKANIAIAMAQFMGNNDLILEALRRTTPEFQNNGHLKRAVKMLDKTDESNEYHNGRTIRINAQRLAFGITMMAEEMYSSSTARDVAMAVRSDIHQQIRTHASTMALLGFALTDNMDVALNTAAESIVSARDLPLAIPADKTEISQFIHALQVANIRPEEFSAPELRDLSGGHEV
jgi:hypothetical protein